MGIVKIRHRGPGNCDHAQRSSCTFTIGELVQEESLLLEKDPGDDYDDYKLPEVGSEYVMVGDQICNLPYELYDLPDLKEILSLEAWNSCLTDDERFVLAAYLPDMDQQTLWLTMKELLSGENVFFGSPLEKLFHRLKGGFCSLQVTQFRECLQFLQRWKYYHSLRSYHESMAQKFMDMKRAWSNCQPSTSIEERVHIWNNRKNHKPVFLVDLNAIPVDEENISKGDKNGATIPLLKKTKYINKGVNTHVSPIVLNGAAVDTKTKARGVLKIRPVEMSSMQNHLVQPLPSDSREPCRRPPKGVLKIKPKSDSLGQQERPRAIPVPPEQPLTDLVGVQTSRLCPPQVSSKWHAENFGENLPFPRQTVRDGKAFICAELPEFIKSQESLNMVAGPNNNSQSSQGKTKMVNDMRLHNAAERPEEILAFKDNEKLRMYTLEAGGIGECRNGENLWLNSSHRSRLHSGSSADSYTFAPENHQGSRRMTPVHPTVSEAISRISTVGTDKPQKFLKSSDHLERKHDLNNTGLKMSSVHMAVSGAQKGLMFPITYKRKKPYKRLNHVDSLKQPSLVANPETMPGGIDCHLIEKAKAVRIKFKGWSDYNAQCN